jgi:predicted ATPase
MVMGTSSTAKPRFYEIVLTGGPCSGKSSFINQGKPKLEEQGFKVIVMNEVPVEVYNSGIYSQDLPAYDFRSIIIKKILDNEDAYRRVAAHLVSQGINVIIFYDRGLFDNKGFCDAETWDRLLERHDLTEEKINRSYDAVFNIVTVAQVSEELWEEHYGENPARYQKTGEDALLREKQVQEDWGNHHNFIVFENDHSGWQGKFERMYEAVCSIVGIPSPA